MSKGITPPALPPITSVTIPKTAKIMPKITVIKLRGLIFSPLYKWLFLDITHSASHSNLFAASFGQNPDLTKEVLFFGFLL
jgi:hypothetical protein